MLNRSASLAMSTRNLKALPDALDIKIPSPSIRFIVDSLDGARCCSPLWGGAYAVVSSSCLLGVVAFVVCGYSVSSSGFVM